MKKILIMLCSLCVWWHVQAQEEATPDPAPDEFIFVDSPPKPLNMDRLVQEIGYPQEAVDNNVSGTVVIRVLVNENGEYKQHKVLSEVHPVLCKAVEEHAPKLRFTPAILEGKTVKFWVNVPFNFKLQQRSQQEQDVDYLTQYINENPESYEAYTQRGIRYLDMGMREQAIEDFTKSISLNPQKKKKNESPFSFLFFAQYSRGKAYAGLQRWDEAQGDFTAALTTFSNIKEPDSSVQASIGSLYADQGFVYYQEEKYPEAMNSYDKAEAASPDLRCNIASLKSDVALGHG